jgi:hypothetical protein
MKKKFVLTHQLCMAAKFMFRAIRGRLRTVYDLQQNIHLLQVFYFLFSLHKRK